MEMIFVKNLKGGEILAKTIFNTSGSLLINAGTTLTTKLISLLESNNIFFVFVLAEDPNVVPKDTIMEELKNKAIDHLPEVFSSILACDPTNKDYLINIVNELTEHIFYSSEITTTLFQVQQFDNYTYLHCVDTGIMAMYLGTAMGYSKNQVKDLGLAGFLHDIGKLDIPNNILNKPGRLTSSEYKIMQTHAEKTNKILNSANIFSKEIIDGASQHHERYDGSGYPNGLSGNNISEFGRILALCDVFTAISSNRCYRDKFNANEAYEFILANKGTLFDPKIVDIFKETFSIYPVGCYVRLSNGLEGYVVKQNPNFADRPIIKILYDKNKKIELEKPYELDLLKNINVTIQDVVMSK